MAKDNQRQNTEPERDDLLEEHQGVFMISVAAELAGMHPQTLRMYEARGLIKPMRSPKRTRLYSQHDVERLRRIQELTTDRGLNLAGVERVLELEQAMATMRRQLSRLRREAEQMEREMLERIDQVHRSYKRELIPWEPPGEVMKPGDAKPFRIPIQKGRSPGGKAGRSERRHSGDRET